ncbi:MAG: MBL fold metallo-hydrolase [Desulfovibrio sp.]|jgi:glyoxylase-like metal-dependent hydrolase (beta-lactamase superfamily II)|nr:MBL fold metallo-hydrolase [Desulfovibrio sp.]
MFPTSRILFPGFFCRVAAVFLACVIMQLPDDLRAAPARASAREIWKAGGMSVTAIQDLPGETEVSIFRGPASEAAREQYFNKGKAEAGYNVFLLRGGGKIALFDAGNGTVRQTPGKLPEILADLGVKPEDVDFVLLTHLHLDHVGGLLEGKNRAFSKARLMVSKPEIAYWTALAGKDPGNRNAAFVKAVIKAYGPDVLPPFDFGDILLPGVTALDASGHTPGHTAFQVEAPGDATGVLYPLDTPGHERPQDGAGGKSLLIIGDLIHGTPLQFALPDECAVYDIDPTKAVLARKRILNLAEQKGIPVAGMHLPFPGGGKVERDGRAWKFERQ